MSNAEKTRERWKVLAELAVKERDPNKLIALVSEINELLAKSNRPPILAQRRGE
jgi:hypothetical protein